MVSPMSCTYYHVFFRNEFFLQSVWASVSGWSSPRCNNQSPILRLVCKLEAGGSVQLARAFLFTKPTHPVSCTASTQRTTQQNRTQHEGQRPSIHIADHAISAAFVRWIYWAHQGTHFHLLREPGFTEQPHRPFTDTQERARDQEHTCVDQTCLRYELTLLLDR